MNEKAEALLLADECEESAMAWANEVTTRQQAAAELRRLHAENEALRKDAERYRWLRSDDIEVPHGQREICVMLMRLPFREDQTDKTLIESELDAAIDAAMKGQP